MKELMMYICDVINEVQQDLLHRKYIFLKLIELVDRSRRNNFRIDRIDKKPNERGMNLKHVCKN